MSEIKPVYNTHTISILVIIVLIIQVKLYHELTLYTALLLWLSLSQARQQTEVGGLCQSVRRRGVGGRGFGRHLHGFASTRTHHLDHVPIKSK